jgi:hypothetical protein
MAKKQTAGLYTPLPKTKRRTKKRGLNIRKTHGPKSNMRIRHGN